MSTYHVGFLNARHITGDFGGAYDDWWSMVGTSDGTDILDDADEGTYVDQKQEWGGFIDDPPPLSTNGYLHGPNTIADLAGLGFEAVISACTLHYKVQLVTWAPGTNPTLQVNFAGGITKHIPLTVGEIVEDTLDLSLDESFDGAFEGSALNFMNGLKSDNSLNIVTQHGDPTDQESTRANGATEIYLYEFYLEIEASVPYVPFGAAMDAALGDINQAFSGD